jgi:hypothetical protein
MGTADDVVRAVTATVALVGPKPLDSSSEIGYVYV